MRSDFGEYDYLHSEIANHLLDRLDVRGCPFPCQFPYEFL